MYEEWVVIGAQLSLSVYFCLCVLVFTFVWMREHGRAARVNYRFFSLPAG